MEREPEGGCRGESPRTMGASAPRGEMTVFVDRASIGFSAAHFSIVETGSEPLHGHNYRVSLRAHGGLRPDGTVIDFALLKAAARAEAALLDHRVLVPTACPQVRVTELDGEVELREGGRRFLLPASDTCLLPVSNTTCECLAGHLLGRLRDRLGEVPVRLEVTVEESPGQGATVVESEH
jgi:6-pyruvoyltetrahydropterin/6-carboxytetrahydropterin synthase